MRIDLIESEMARRGWSFVQLGDAVGLTADGVRKPVRGGLRSLRSALPISLALDIPLDVLYEDEIEAHRVLLEGRLEKARKVPKAARGATRVRRDIHDRMEELGIGATALSSLVGVTPTTIGILLHAPSGEMSIGLAIRMAAVLQMSLADLLAIEIEEARGKFLQPH